MILIDNNPIEDKRFPDKTPLMRVTDDFCKQKPVTITWKYDNDAELFQLICITKHLQSIGCEHIELNMPYIPNARMDRVKETDEVFTLKYFAEIINSLNFKHVTVLDAHSNVSLGLIDRITSVSPKQYVQEAIQLIGGTENLAMFFPDEGAMKRYASLASEFDVPYVFGMKNRDWRTGEIKGLEILGQIKDVNSKDILIIDDISSRGGTFYHSAKALKQVCVNKIYLYVSHCENTILEGELINSGLVERIFTTDSIYRAKHDLITVL